MVMTDKLHVDRLAVVKLHKCECCGRVRDIPYKLFVHDKATGLYLGDFDLCDDCGRNMASLLEQALPDEYSVAEWSWDGDGDGN